MVQIGEVQQLRRQRHPRRRAFHPLQQGGLKDGRFQKRDRMAIVTTTVVISHLFSQSKRETFGILEGACPLFTLNLPMVKLPQTIDSPCTGSTSLGQIRSCLLYTSDAADE